VGMARPGGLVHLRLRDVLPTRVGMARTRNTSLYFSAGEKNAKNK